MDVTVAKTFGPITHYSCGLPSLQKISLRKKKKTRFAVKADSSRESGGSSIVDEGMLVLRKRIHQLRMEERNYLLPQNWTEWEKKWYPTYCSGVYSSLGWLQNMLINTRPGFAVAFLALISLSGPASVLILLIQSPIPLKQLTVELISYLRR
ncbi:hypothetical protein SUGI_0107290 [Cryptomeria japonica]|uniref:uncharacterized protein LOC131073708 n=1 Tax=Cryptomeria japonica TaxID=3369 RepID=UPI002408BF3A|nr:uncharacterized protein LOC131073708 [Cryptomeria japonica]GLJ09358.1 hypothetical protein SUGI_0107290 [Cryptomeria japonica]